MNHTNGYITSCPKCTTPLAPKYAAYGFCEFCKDYDAASVAYDPTTYTPVHIQGGGGFRCCSESVRAWAVFHPGPWNHGLKVCCVHHLNDQTHRMVYCTICNPDGRWHYLLGACPDPDELLEEDYNDPPPAEPAERDYC